MRKLRVYGKAGFVKGVSGQVNVAVAAQSLSAAAKALRCTLYEMSIYGGQTWNAATVEAAMSSPGRVFWRPLDDRAAAWSESPE